MDLWTLLQILGFFALIWIIICILVSFASGWAALAQRFRYDGEFSGSRFGLRHAPMRLWVGQSVEVGANLEGLHLSVLSLSRIGHPPLLIPWREVWVGQKGKILWFYYVELELGKDNRIPLRISDELAERLKQAAGSAWVDPTEPRSQQIGYSSGS